MSTFARMALFAAASLAALSVCSLANAQGIYLGPGGVGVDTGVRVDDGYHRERERHHRDYEERRRFRDEQRDGGYGYRKHRHDDYQQEEDQ